MFLTSPNPGPSLPYVCVSALLLNPIAYHVTALAFVQDSFKVSANARTAGLVTNKSKKHL